MSPGGTMLRVYAALKERVMAGEFAPGERLDPKRLADDLLSSTSPVRDALHRLHGEHLVESFAQEGFRAIRIVEPAIRDLYDWSEEVMRIVLTAVSRAPPLSGGSQAPPAEDVSYPRRVSDCFMTLALRSPNHEHRLAIAGLLDRSALYRPVEALVLADAARDVDAINTAVADGDWPAAAAAIGHFHRRRIAVVATIAAQLRPRSAG